VNGAGGTLISQRSKGSKKGRKRHKPVFYQKDGGGADCGLMNWIQKKTVLYEEKKKNPGRVSHAQEGHRNLRLADSGKDETQAFHTQTVYDTENEKHRKTLSLRRGERSLHMHSDKEGERDAKGN